MYLEIGLGTVILIEGYVVWNLIRKTELLETWVENFTQTIETVQNDLKIQTLNLQMNILVDFSGHLMLKVTMHYQINPNYFYI